MRRQLVGQNGPASPANRLFNWLSSWQADYAADLASQLSSHVLIMDEVDGMAGNEDRGGMQELIAVIKTSRVPIICLCNDRQSPKVRSLANYCLDLRFHRPRMEQIKAAVLSLACRESVTIGNHVLEGIIAASNQDMRQVINSVQMWCTDGTAADKEISLGAAGAQKNLRLGPFDVILIAAPLSESENSLTCSLNGCLQ
ncbi:unnamed protein product [Dibothriocephalus latus]|uniref:ATPase AAA-type core domain-containing protein n=1 Tax=Dibothriocephalus latus TaxID=60516 RepID=A0A3P7LAS8_DIBLA|nr:unnamed protein product [Dibothriocephalus latus]